jgi:hypothetical protein
MKPLIDLYIVGIGKSERPPLDVHTNFSCRAVRDPILAQVT